MNIYIREYEDCAGFCVVDIQDISSPISFSFNLSYLFEWVEERHYTGFLIDVFDKKIGKVQDWSGIDFDEIVTVMMGLYHKSLKK